MDYSDPYPADAEQFMILEIISTDVEHINEQMKEMMSNTVNIERLQKDVDKLQKDVEKLKDKQRTFSNGEHQ